VVKWYHDGLPSRSHRFKPGRALCSPSGPAAMFSVVKTRERELARSLRRNEGASIKEIAQRLGVSPSSASLWVRDVDLTPAQHDALRLRNPAYNRQLSGRAVASANRRAERQASQMDGRRLARLHEPLHVAGCMLYWAEGARDGTNSSSRTRILSLSDSSSGSCAPISISRRMTYGSPVISSPTTFRGNGRLSTFGSTPSGFHCSHFASRSSTCTRNSVSESELGNSRTEHAASLYRGRASSKASTAPSKNSPASLATSGSTCRTER
jgi:transcriptional regulator with XRE-family HTH domain